MRIQIGVLIDLTLYKRHPGDEADVFQMLRSMEPPDPTALFLNCVVVYSHR